MLASAQSRTAGQPPAHEILRSRLVNEFLTNFYRVVADFLTASSQYRMFLYPARTPQADRPAHLAQNWRISLFALAARPRSACREDAMRPKLSPACGGPGIACASRVS